jgi:hypothetical protein
MMHRLPALPLAAYLSLALLTTGCVNPSDLNRISPSLRQAALDGRLHSTTLAVSKKPRTGPQIVPVLNPPGFGPELVLK